MVFSLAINGILFICKLKYAKIVDDQIWKWNRFYWHWNRITWLDANENFFECFFIHRIPLNFMNHKLGVEIWNGSKKNMFKKYYHWKDQFALILFRFFLSIDMPKRTSTKHEPKPLAQHSISIRTTKIEINNEIVC